jgi:hypothetical protein
MTDSKKTILGLLKQAQGDCRKIQDYATQQHVLLRTPSSWTNKTQGMSLSNLEALTTLLLQRSDKLTKHLEGIQAFEDTLKDIQAFEAILKEEP